MHIILVSDRLATARTIVITGRQMLLALFGLILAIFGLSSLISFLAVQHAADVRLPVLNSVLRAIQAEE
ncbi:MAG TPA: hypothetical protein VGE56_08650, partial [Rhodocyclaceae bacterium]